METSLRAGNLLDTLKLSRFLKELRGGVPRRGPVPLSPRRIYILPSREGLAALFVFGALLLGSINFQSGLGMGLTFLLCAMTLVSIIDTQRNLAGMVVTVLDAEPVFAGESAHFPLHLENPRTRPRHSLFLRSGSKKKPKKQKPKKKKVEQPPPLSLPLDAPPGLTTAVMERTFPARGVHPLGLVTVETFFPLHLFRAWAPFLSGAEVVVYPKARGGAPLPFAAGGLRGEQERDSTQIGGREGGFAGFRTYTPGDTISEIDWKASAKGDSLLLRQYHQLAEQEVLLDYGALPGMDPEARLEQLCQWILTADRLGLDYALKLPAKEISVGKGPIHKRSCLELLARFNP